MTNNAEMPQDIIKYVFAKAKKISQQQLNDQAGGNFQRASDVVWQQASGHASLALSHLTNIINYGFMSPEELKKIWGLSGGDLAKIEDLLIKFETPKK